MKHVTNPNFVHMFLTGYVFQKHYDLCSHKNDVDKYNDFLIHKTFQNHEFFFVIIKINAMGITKKKKVFYNQPYNSVFELQ